MRVQVSLNGDVIHRLIPAGLSGLHFVTAPNGVLSYLERVIKI